ncbi:MAG: GGDEF domain-containing protein [Spirochaetales bacterium]|nr:GGDEF domain-containing protein [Spirochaetales bacterium]
MKSAHNNNIFLVTNNLGDFTSSLEKKIHNFNHASSSFDLFQRNMGSLGKRKQDKYIFTNDLIIIDKEFYDTSITKSMKQEFLERLKIEYPHFLFIVKTKKDKRNLNLDYYEDDFHYYVSEEEKKTKILNINDLFLDLVFKCMVNRRSVHYYIVNSFENIIESVIISNQKKKIESVYRDLEATSKIDVLTNVLNRRAFFEAMELEKKRTERAHNRLSETPEIKIGVGIVTKFYGRFCCVMIDIDNFKRINDSYGHINGDKVLKALGRLFNSHSLFRDDDIIGRYGGEEFVIILPETNIEYAKIPAERFRRAVKAIEFESDKGTFSISVSIGISEYQRNDKNCEDIIKRADEALLAAKAGGKDRIICYQDIS